MNKNKVFINKNYPPYIFVAYEGSKRNEHIFNKEIPLHEDGKVEIEWWSLTNFEAKNNGDKSLMPFEDLIHFHMIWNENTIDSSRLQ